MRRKKCAISRVLLCALWHDLSATSSITSNLVQHVRCAAAKINLARLSHEWLVSGGKPRQTQRTAAWYNFRAMMTSHLAIDLGMQRCVAKRNEHLPPLSHAHGRVDADLKKTC